MNINNYYLELQTIYNELSESNRNYKLLLLLLESENKDNWETIIQHIFIYSQKDHIFSFNKSMFQEFFNQNKNISLYQIKMI